MAYKGYKGCGPNALGAPKSMAKQVTNVFSGIAEGAAKAAFGNKTNETTNQLPTLIAVNGQSESATGTTQGIINGGKMGAKLISEKLKGKKLIGEKLKGKKLLSRKMTAKKGKIKRKKQDSVTVIKPASLQNLTTAKPTAPIPPTKIAPLVAAVAPALIKGAAGALASKAINGKK